MKDADQNQRLVPQKSQGSSRRPPKKVQKKVPLLDKLIVTIVIGTLGYVGITFVNCNFMVPGSIEKANVLGSLKNPPSLKCENSINQGYSVLSTLLTTLIALKTRLD